uniref:OBG-type G domain-containing protein n=1 Tax=Aureoumbra lagunensis TaxID=44058 RepID=A0A7S3NNS0_9STRA|mmetsp:Transcript_11905/g.16130  ORF Transcript_11905/g.16130 Transcript_11905/m.16130 type:complete len:501 (+) Transcript_11905:45-1547(+)
MRYIFCFLLQMLWCRCVVRPFCMSHKASRYSRYSADRREMISMNTADARNERKAAAAAAAVKLRSTGRLSQLPTVIASDELIRRAKVAATKIPYDKSIYHLSQRVRKRSREQANAIGQAVSIPVRELIQAYDLKNLEQRLHPFEFATARLTARHRTREGYMSMEDILVELKNLRNGVLETSKATIQQSKNATNTEEVILVIENLLKDVEGRIKAKAHVLNELKLLGRAFRRLPTVDLSTPTVVLVGAPNVGKSTLVRLLSTGEPTIGNYPFTTRGVSMGHVLRETDAKISQFQEKEKYDDNTQSLADMNGRHVRRRRMDIIGQVVDTPGLLARSDDETRNDMEELTLATMRFLPSAVVFVLDLSGAAGDDKSSPQDQIKVRDSLRALFPKRPWIDVVSKADLLDFKKWGSTTSTSDHQIEESRDKFDENGQLVQFVSPENIQAPPEAIFVSVKHDRGTDDLKAAVAHLHSQVAAVARAYAAAALAPRPSIIEEKQVISHS